MRKNLLIAAWSFFALAGTSALAQETFNENATDKVQDRVGVAGQTGVAPNAAGANVNSGIGNRARGNAAIGNGAAASGAGNANWRFRHHNGHWWYYHPNNQWSYHNGNSWTGYTPQGYNQWYNTQFQRSGNNYGGYGNSRYYSGYRGNTGGYGNNMYRSGNMYGNGYGAYGNGYGGGNAGANLGGALGGAVGGARGANVGAAVGGGLGGGRR